MHKFDELGYGTGLNSFDVGDRVELHPGCDLWAMGARYGTVTGYSNRGVDMLRVRMDNPHIRRAQHIRATDLRKA